jgi:hypothetical protein
LNRAVPELLIVLQREVQLTKDEWRSAGAQRRLAAYDVEARLLAVWSRFRGFGDGIVRVPLGADGEDEPGSHEALKPKHLIPGFSIRREGDVFDRARCGAVPNVFRFACAGVAESGRAARVAASAD